MTNNYYFHRGGLEDSVRNAGFPVLIVNIDNRHASEPLREKEPMNVTQISRRKMPLSIACVPGADPCFLTPTGIPSPV